MFRKVEKVSQSKGKTQKYFETYNPSAGTFEPGQMSHLTKSITATGEQLTAQSAPYLKNAGAQITKAITKNITQGAIQQAKVASPSRETEMVGASIAQGFIVGAEGYVDDARAVGSKLGSGMVQTASGLFVPGGATSGGTKSTTPGININDIAAKARMNRDALLSAESQKQIAKMNTRMDRLNRGFMSGTFALSALSGVASMAGGNLGKFSEILFQISGPMFALSSIIQLLTGSPILKTLKDLGKFKLGSAAIVLTTFFVTTKLINDARKKELEYINGLSNAMKTTTSQAKTLGDFFGVVPTKLPFETKNREVVNKKTRSTRDRLREDESFQKQFAPTIKTLSSATAKEASLAFTTLALNLKAQGFASEQVQTIIDALREEARKTSVELDVKSLDFSAESIKGLQNQIAPIVTELERNLKTRLTQSERILSGFQSALFGRGFRMEELTNASQKSLSDLAGTISSVSNSAVGMFRGGLISGEDFNATMFGIVETTKSLNAESQKLVFLETFKKLNVDATPFLANIKDLNTQMIILKLLSAGIL